jgi:hypothetical protein
MKRLWIALTLILLAAMAQPEGAAQVRSDYRIVPHDIIVIDVSGRRISRENSV